MSTIGLNKKLTDQNKLQIPRVVIGGATSGVGKTLITCAIIYGLKKKGYSIQPFKVGPDYIDPSFLSLTSGTPSRNLDPWLMKDGELLRNFIVGSTKDISIIEGVMGYYDGVSGKSSSASTFDVATKLDCQSILIIDAAKTSRSIGAIVLGFTKFHSNSRIAGIILNKIGSKKHESFCRQALSSLGIPVFGVIPRNKDFELESRHLGLVPAIEQKKHHIRKISKTISEYINLDAIVKLCKRTPPLQNISRENPKPVRTVIGVALDSSFNFYYQENLEALRLEGAQLEFFSPVSDSVLPNCDGLYIGGGFPEVQSQSLSRNQGMRRSIRKSLEDQMPLYAECGGLMYLTRSIKQNTKKFPMVGFFDAYTEMTGKMILNYTKGTVISNNVILPAHRRFHAHEFHYSKLYAVPSDAKFAYRLTVGEGIRDGLDGLLQNNVLASYNHMILSSKSAKRFVTATLSFARK